MKISDKAILNNGVEIPYFGFGTYQIKSNAAKEAVLNAFESGYRLIDTATAYDNEKEIGEGIRDSGLLREEIFVTTKLWNEDQGYETTLDAFERSLDSLNLSYIDLYLLHWPVTGKRLESWRALEKIVESDRCRSVGVSNFTIRHLEDLLEASSVVPAVNQVEFSPFLYQKDLLEYCRQKEIALEAYTPLARGKKFDHPVIKDLSGRYHKTPAQIILRWGLEHNLIVIPKSVHKNRIIENANIFDFSITPEDMKKLDSLNEGFRIAWDPNSIP